MDEQEKTGKQPPEAPDKKGLPKGRVISSDYRDMFPKQQERADKLEIKSKRYHMRSEEAVKSAVKNARANVHEGFGLLKEQAADTDEAALRGTSTSEAVPDRYPEFHARGKRRKMGLATGIVVLLLALTGVGYLAATIGNQIYRAATDDSKERAYDAYLKPLVMQDPEEFDEPVLADEEMVLSASLWKALEDHNTAYTDYDDMGRTIVPLADVSDACHALFGPDVELQLNNLDEDNFFTFNEDTNQFHVTPYSTQSSFVPYTESIGIQADGKTVLRVGYVAPSDAWRSEDEDAPERPSPVKYMEYVLAQTEDGKEYVAQLREPQEGSLAASSQI